eukprot:2917396-Pyramimonas_sp.AAC.1
MEVLGEASRTRLDRYKEKVCELAEDYPQYWFIVALADMHMRSEHLERIRRRCAKEHKDLVTAKLPSAFEPEHPWDYVLREAARDDTFWAKE